MLWFHPVILPVDEGDRHLELVEAVFQWRVGKRSRGCGRRVEIGSGVGCAGPLWETAWADRLQYSYQVGVSGHALRCQEPR